MVLIVAGAVAAAALPPAEPPAVDQSPQPTKPSVAVCPVQEGSGRATDLVVLSSVSAPVEATVFAAGAGEETLAAATGPTGSVTIPAADLSAVGRVGALIEMSGQSFAAGFTTAGEATLSGEPCFHDPPPQQTFISGGSTAEGHEFELQLMNPYSGEAVVDLVVQSETGRETSDRFETLVVPAKGSTIVDMTALIPRRNTISVAVETVSGRTVVVGTQRRGGDNASWRAVEAGSDWYLPIPAGFPGASVELATPMNAEIDYQIDLYGPEGLLEAWQSGTLQPRGNTRVDLTELVGESAAIRVVASGPLVPTLWSESDEAGLAATTASPLQAPSWLLPGAARPPGGSGTLILVNTGADATVATVRTIRDGSSQQQVSLGVDAVVEVPLALARGYRVDSDGSIVAMWVAQRGTAAVAAMGVPLADG